MSFIGDVLGGKANTFQATAPENKFQATAAQNPFQAQQATLNQTDTSGQIQQAGQNYQDIYGQQQQSNQQLRDLGAGKGPNPALAQLSQTTGNNINAATGQAASARGVNPAMKARMASDTAAGLNSQASGQAATLAAQQQLGAQSQLANNLQGQGSQATGMFGTAGGLQQGQNALNIQNLGQQQQLNQLTGAQNAGFNMQAQGMNQQTAAQNAALNLGAQQINSGAAAQNAGINAGMTGGLLNGVGGMLSMFARGGSVPGSRSPIHLYMDSLYDTYKPQKMATGGYPDMIPESQLQGSTFTPDGARADSEQPRQMPRLGEGELRQPDRFGVKQAPDYKLQEPTPERTFASQRPNLDAAAAAAGRQKKDPKAWGEDALGGMATALGKDSEADFYRATSRPVLGALLSRGGPVQHLSGGGHTGFGNIMKGIGGGLTGQPADADASSPLEDITGLFGSIFGGGGGGGSGAAAGMGGGMMGGGGAASGAAGGGAGALAALSDERAKKNIHREGREALPGVREATFQYRGEPGKYEGVIAQDVLKVRPDLVTQGEDGYLRVAPELAPHLMSAMAQGGMAGGSFMGDGPVPGQPRTPGRDVDSNDTVPALLTPKEIVLPLSVTQSSNPGEKAKRFVEHLTRRSGKSGFEKVVKARSKKKG